MKKKRIDEIREFLQLNGRVVVNELADKYHVSEVSIRKDLNLLARLGYCRKVYGGAVLSEQETQVHTDGVDFYSDLTRISIARRTLLEIKDDDCIFLGSGTTCCVLARLLKGFRNLTVVTNNVTALTDLLNNVARVYLVGGEVTTVDHITLFSSWERPESFIENIFVNKAFTSASGLDVKAGLTVNAVISTHIYRYVPTMAHQWYLMADSSKFDRIAIYSVAELNKIQAIISDQVPEKYLDYFRNNNIQVIYAES
ncbi:MAG: DeoR/GlpR family DNA-binding transcription regulator [Propionivibrio sp.]